MNMSFFLWLILCTVVVFVAIATNITVQNEKEMDSHT